MGGLRFKLTEDGPFLNDNRTLAAPPWTSIRELEQVSLRLEEDDVVNDPEYLNWLNMLIAPGSSLGGARPKASVVDNKGHLWIAKFPSRNDEGNVGAWEWVTYQIALNGVSYLELVEFLSTKGANVTDNLHQLWRRIVFSMCVSNTDDHLRNHGFMLTSTGWELSPAYDINPVETGFGLKLNVSEDDNAIDLDLARSVAPYFRLNNEQVEQIITEIKSAVQSWRRLAEQAGISRNEIELKSNAFRLVNS